MELSYVMQSTSRLLNFKRENDIVLDSEGTSSGYILSVKVKREIKRMTDDEFLVIKSKRLSPRTKIDQRRMVSTLCERVEPLDVATMNYFLSVLKDEGREAFFDLFYLKEKQVQSLVKDSLIGVECV